MTGHLSQRKWPPEFPCALGRSTLLVCILQLCVTAHLSANTELQFHGFLTASGGITSANKMRVLDYNSDLSFESDSIYGLQATARIEDRFDITTQFVSRGSENFRTEVDWAYIDYEWSHHLTTKMGRMRVPLYMFSQVLEVGYAYPWIHPPREMYAIVPFTSFNGLDVILKHYFYNYDSALEFYLGSLQEDIDLFGSRSELTLRNLFGIIWTLEKNRISARLGIHVTDASATFNEFDELYMQLENAGFGNVADDLRLHNKRGEFFELAFRAELDNVQLLIETTQLLPQRSIIPEHPSWYALIGYRYAEKTLLHFTVSDVNARDNNSSIGQEIPAGVDTGLDALKAAIQSALFAADTKQRSYIVGIRHDYVPGLALKFEIHRIFTHRDRSTLIERRDPDNDKPFTFFNFALDAVF